MVDNFSDIDILWIIISAFLVFLMQLGFAMVETGTVRAKNTINVAMKNLIDTIFGVLVFWVVGFGLMFGADVNGLFGETLFLIDGNNMHVNAFFFFQSMFAATAVTIVSGAVAERMKFNGYIVTAIVVIACIYPVFGHWSWSEGGWLKSMGFVDFAGSTVVHSMGAWIGLAGAIMLGPRLGKFRRGKVNYFAPSNHNFIVFGIFILWFAWFGFNAGSLLAYDISVARILVNTLIAGASGGLAGYMLSLIFKERVGVEIFSFGILSGLVGVTAGCHEFSIGESSFVGFLAAIIMFVSDQILTKKLKVDDPLSVVGIHGFAGVWGTLAVGFFASLPEGLDRLSFIGIQATGVLTAFAFAFISGLLLFYILKRFNALRVSKKREVVGLNVAEHNARLPWVDTVESIIKIMRTGNLQSKIYVERHTEVGIVASFFNYLLSRLRNEQIKLTDSNKILRNQANTDPLTHIMNRRGLMGLIKDMHPFVDVLSVMIFDIDKFKLVNDTYGHSCGDDVIVGISNAIVPLLREGDLFARWGGEEFVIVVRTIDLHVIEEMAERLRKHIEKISFPKAGNVTCSFGVSSPKDVDSHLDTLIENADKALYKAKELGRNRVCSW